MKPTGIGVLSHAHAHVDTYCRVLRAVPDVALIATWDAHPERGRRAASEFGFDLRPSPAAVAQDPAVDAILIGSPTNEHADLVEVAAASGKAILLQKPMATTLEGCDRICRAVAQHGVSFSMAFQMRHDPVNRKMKELLDAGAIGHVAIVRRRHSIGVLLNPQFAAGLTAWHVDPVQNVGMFFDDATHAADWFLWMFGMPVSVVAEIDAIVRQTAPDDNGVALYRFRSGEIGVLLNSATTVAAVNTTEIYGDEGTIVHDYGDSPSTGAPRRADAVPLRLIRRGESRWTEFPLAIPTAHGERIEAVIRPFIAYVRGECGPAVTAEEGRRSVEMVLAAYRSAAEGRRVTFPFSG